jgi:hypothetical protein
VNGYTAREHARRHENTANDYAVLLHSLFDAVGMSAAKCCSPARSHRQLDSYDAVADACC